MKTVVGRLKLGTAAALAVTFVGSQVGAATLGSLDIGGVVVDGGASTTLTLDVLAGELTSIDFDFDVEHFTPSWGSETVIEIIAPEGEVFAYDNDDFGFPDSPGTYSFDGSFAEGPASTLGTWTFNFTDNFDDAINPDHQYLDGSSISISGISAVPLPAGFLLGLTGLTSLAGLGAVGRRRRKIAAS